MNSPTCCAQREECAEAPIMDCDETFNYVVAWRSRIKHRSFEGHQLFTWRIWSSLSFCSYDVLWGPWTSRLNGFYLSTPSQEGSTGDRWQSCLDTKEPIHYVTYGSGMQTWDSCLQPTCLQSLKDLLEAFVTLQGFLTDNDSESCAGLYGLKCSIARVFFWAFGCLRNTPRNLPSGRSMASQWG